MLTRRKIGKRSTPGEKKGNRRKGTGERGTGKGRRPFPFPLSPFPFSPCPALYWLFFSQEWSPYSLNEHPADNVTKLLIELSNGDRDAVDLLLPVIYDELRKLAANYLRRERPDHTLQPTALVHEAYLRLVDQTRVNWQNRAHFFGVAAQIMRRLLVDHARKHNAEKRGQDFQKLSLDENIDRAVERSAELIALDDALKSLAVLDEQKARMVELRYFGGLSIEETADVLGVTPTTIKRHWRMARAWLYGEMQKK